ncbi:MAG: MFS transporter [Burkholderiales bacterium PBB4]|nr:MAG: MFS transporter [Burkholderiales bacterium PBB4]
MCCWPHRVPSNFSGASQCRICCIPRCGGLPPKTLRALKPNCKPRAGGRGTFQIRWSCSSPPHRRAGFTSGPALWCGRAFCWPMARPRGCARCWNITHKLCVDARRAPGEDGPMSHDLSTSPPVPVTAWLRVVLLWLSGVLAAMQFSKISVAFGALQSHYAASSTSVGWILSTVGLVGLVLGVTAGLCAPALGYKRMLVLGLGLGALFAAVQTWVHTLPLLWVTRLFEGLSHVSVVVAAPTLILQSCAPRHRALAVGLWSTFVGVAFAITASGGAWVLAHFQLQGLLQVHAGGMLLIAMAMLVVVPPDSPVRPAWPTLASLPRRHAQLYRGWATALPALCFFCYTSSAIALFTFVPQVAGAELSWLAAAMPLVTLSGALCAGGLGARVSRPLRVLRWVFCGVLLVALCLGGALAAHWAVAPSTLLLMALLGLSGGLSYGLIPYLNHAAALQAQATGAVAQMGNLGSALGAPLFGALIASLGTLGVVVPVCGFALLGWGLTTAGMRRLAL